MVCSVTTSHLLGLVVPYDDYYCNNYLYHRMEENSLSRLEENFIHFHIPILHVYLHLDYIEHFHQLQKDWLDSNQTYSKCYNRRYRKKELNHIKWRNLIRRFLFDYSFNFWYNKYMNIENIGDELQELVEKFELTKSCLHLKENQFLP